MSTDTQNASVSKSMLWTGRILSALPILFMLFGAAFFLLKPAVAAQGAAHYAYPDGAMLRIVYVEIVCVILYAIPRTSVLGAILLTAYLGGATATHVRVSEPFFIPVIMGIVVWAGLVLRDPKLRALLPWRS